MLYYIASALNRRHFPHYQHHRPLKVFSEGFIWIKSLWRKLKFSFTERDSVHDLFIETASPYFLVILQVHSDMQVKVHSPYPTVESFIEESITSFAKNAPQNTRLVLKHHPFDRGYRNYSQLIRKLGNQYEIIDRLVYLHDCNLPNLLQRAQGVVTINSTVGLSSLR